MKPVCSAVRICFVVFGLCSANVLASGPLERVPNVTLTNLPPNPPTFGFTAANALGALTFTNAVCLAVPPGETNRLFVLEKRGRIIVITNLAAPTRTVFMDITGRVAASDTQGDERGLLGLAFHPGYASNRYFYVYYTTTTSGGASGLLHDTLARFETDAANPNAGLPNSEQLLLLQRDEANNHNGGDLHFGPDGYLYVSLGDEGGGNDAFGNSQRITKDFFSAILRLDVDKRPGSLLPNPHPAVVAPTNYLVPADNPFVGATSFNGIAVNSNQVRTEFWAVGLRNPWRMFFDRETGLLYCGDVGQGPANQREEIDLIVKGANYGWNYWEGNFQRTNSAQIPAGFVHTPPLYDYAVAGGAVTGGVLYRGQRLSQLYGAYIFADYVNGQFRALRHVGTSVTEVANLMVDQHATAFGTDPRNGDILYADVSSPTAAVIKRINYNNVTNGAPLPPTLAAVGAFTNIAALAPAPGIVPYDVNLPPWADHALVSRWFSVPNTNLTITFHREGNWSFPTGSVWIKHFELELTNGVPASRQRIETQLLVKNSNGVHGVTYRWGSSTTNAALVPEEGMNESFIIDDGGGILRTQVWRYPSRAECLQCHTEAGGFAPGFNTAQLNRDFNYDGDVTNQIAALSLAGYFKTNVTGLHTLQALAHPTNDAVSREYRARSYLAANCAHCHQPGGPAMGNWDGRITTTTANAGLIHGDLVNNGGDADNRVIKPGSLTHSMLLTRISTTGAGRMPPAGSTMPDAQAIALFSAWLTNDLPNYQNFADWQVYYFGSTNAPNAGPDDDADADRAGNYLEYLTQTVPTNALDAWRISAGPGNGAVQIKFPQIANRGFEVQMTTDVLNPAAWSPLDVAANVPFFAISNRTAVVEDVVANATNRFYRVRVFEP